MLLNVKKHLISSTKKPKEGSKMIPGQPWEYR